AVGTPPSQNGGADLSYVKSAITWVCDRAEEGVIVMKSTVPPGTGLRLLETILGATSWDYVSNPEFLREGCALDDWFHPDRIVVGANRKEVLPIIEALYEETPAPYVVTDITSAEMIKYSANAFLATKISFINEIAMLSEKVNANIDDVARGISLDPRIGSSFLNAGVGYGGSCFPKDTQALDDLALNNGHNFELLKSVIRVNNRQRLLPLYALRELFGRLDGVSVGVLGLAFKPNTDDVRESPSLDLIRALLEEGADVRAYDPMATANARRALPESVTLMSEPKTCAEGAQALVLMTEWPQIVGADWEEISSITMSPKFLFDGRNALEPEQMSRLGFHYLGVGRRASVPSHRSAAIAVEPGNGVKQTPAAPLARTSSSV
ncbi:MAG: UDP-glucose/GDP-mannose dehydrogenase family protein, partial [Chloroflexi bacterium]|nr:UDP-glucose/GDP-mannose dehydrogenase family protein [Chloroflexota bacterium]